MTPPRAEPITPATAVVAAYLMRLYEDAPGQVRYRYSKSVVIRSASLSKGTLMIYELPMGSHWVPAGSLGPPHPPGLLKAFS